MSTTSTMRQWAMETSPSCKLVESVTAQGLKMRHPLALTNFQFGSQSALESETGIGFREAFEVGVLYKL
jgi:hypothetical protein